MLYRYRLSLIASLSLLVAACGSDASKDGTGSGNSLNPGVASPDGHQAAQASFEAADNAGSNDASPAAAAGGAQKLAKLSLATDTAQLALRRDVGGVSVSFNSRFQIQGCEAALSSNVAYTSAGVSLDANIFFDPDTCTKSRKLSGTALLQLTSNANERLIRVTENLTQTLVNGDEVTITSGTAGEPTYILRGTGSAAQGNTTLSVTVDEHRKRLASTGNVVFDINVATDANAPLQVVNGYASDANEAVGNIGVKTRTVVSGTNVLVHNLARYTARHTFNALHHTLDTCNCPDGGSIAEEVKYQDATLGSYSRIYTFTACGEASVVTQSSTNPNVIVGTTQVTWDSCH